MTRTLAATACLLLTAPARAFAGSWEIDPAHTTSAFEVTHMMLSNVRGDFARTTGKVEIDEKDVTRSKIDVVIDASTIDTRLPDRDKHLRSPDFFDVEKHPQITFTSTKVERKGKHRLEVTGDLTMRGVTRPVVLDVRYSGEERKSPWGTTVRGASATAKINRKDWGLVWNKTLDGGGYVLSDEVRLFIDVELVPATVTPD